MAKFLVEATYSDEGLVGLRADGAAKRLRDVKAAAKSVGAKVEACYFSFGDSDVILLVDAPDNIAAAAISVAATSSGTVSLRTTPLLTIEEMDKALTTVGTVKYRPAGGAE